MAAMLPGVADAKGDPNLGRCVSEMKQALKAVGLQGIEIEDFDHIVLGTNGPNPRLDNPPGPTLICGFDGNDWPLDGLRVGDVFVGGPGSDVVGNAWSGVFIGGTGQDRIDVMWGGNYPRPEGTLFLGGPDVDRVWNYHLIGAVTGRCLDVESSRDVLDPTNLNACPAP